MGRPVTISRASIDLPLADLAKLMSESASTASLSCRACFDVVKAGATGLLRRQESVAGQSTKVLVHLESTWPDSRCDLIDDRHYGLLRQRQRNAA